MKKKQLESPESFIILDWLNTKKNYISYKEEDDLLSYIIKTNLLFFEARVCEDYLEPCDCYIIHNNDNIIDCSIEYVVKNTKYFKSHNVNRNEYVYDRANLKEISKYFSQQDNLQNRSRILTLLEGLLHSFVKKNNFIDDSEQYSYKNIFFDISDQHEAKIFMDDIKLLMSNKDKYFEEFRDRYFKRIYDSHKDLKEIGIFYPFKIDHDIFAKKYYLFEINNYKLMKNDKNLINIVKDFYKKLGVNGKEDRPLFTLSHYFLHCGNYYSKEFAYFDPFRNLFTYEKQYKLLRKDIIKKDTKNYREKYKSFLFELFEIFNLIQFNFVQFQHKNVEYAIILYRSEYKKNDHKKQAKDIRECSFKEYIQKEEKRVFNELNINPSNQQFLSLLQELLKMNFENKLYFDSTLYKIACNMDSDDKYYLLFIYIFLNIIDHGLDINRSTNVINMKYLAYAPLNIRKRLQSIIYNFFTLKRTNPENKLKYILDKHKKDVLELCRKYDLNNENIKTIEKMLLSLLFFYNNKNTVKLSAQFNKEMENIVIKNSKVSPFDLQDNSKKFIDKYSSEFDKYRTFSIEDEKTGKTIYFPFGGLENFVSN